MTQHSVWPTLARWASRARMPHHQGAPARLTGTRVRLAWACLLGLTCVFAAPLQALGHEPGIARVDIDVAASGHVVVMVPADPLVIWRDQILEAGRVPPAAAGAAQVDAMAPDLARHLARRVQLRADDQPVRLEVAGHEWTVDRPGVPPTARRLVVRLEGRLPSAAARLSWAHALAVGDYPVSLRQDGRAEPRVVWVLGERASAPLPLEPVGTWGTIRQYTWLGVVHIVPRGLDHILFVLGLFLLARDWRPLLLQVSAFTVAHTLTLGVSALGLVRFPPEIVEPLIAASIAWVALENVWRARMSRARVAVVFGFGLLHGAGFAGVLGELGLPTGARLLALVSFNAGVELGQLAVLATAFAVTALVPHDTRKYRRWVVVPASLAIAAVGAYWTVARLTGA